MAQFDEYCRTATGPRMLGLFVLVATLGLIGWLLSDGGAPVWTWAMLGIFLLISGLATVHNFGDRWHVTDEGLSYRNTLTGRLGWPRAKSVSWERVERASDYEGRTWFLTIQGEKRWVLDQLAEHDRLGLVLQQLGIPVSSIKKPRPLRRDGDDPTAPR